MTSSQSERPFAMEDYDDVSPLDGGSFGEVVCARHRKTGRLVALKRVKASKGLEKIEAESAGAELQEAVAAQYPGMVPAVYERGYTADGGYAVAMELVRGRSLTGLTHRPNAREQVLAISIQLARFLVALRRIRIGNEPPQGVVHSDLKPDHVLVLDDGTIRVLDFGITKQVSETRPATTNKFLSIPYSSPERLGDGNVHPNDDAWSVGVMLFEMIAGAHPWARFEGDDGELMAAIRRREPPSPLPSNCTPGLRAIVLKMLAPQIERRYSSPEAFLSDLELVAVNRDRDTQALGETERASRATRAVPRAQPVPTLPLPATVLPGADTAPASLASNRPVRTAYLFSALARVPAGRILRVMVAILLTGFLISEGVVWVRAEQLGSRINQMQVEDVSSVKAEIIRLRGWALLGAALRFRAEPILRTRLLNLAEPILAEYRTENPTVREPQWKEAASLMSSARQLWPDDTQVRARSAYIDGHLNRIRAEDQPKKVKESRLNEAVSSFENAASLDSRFADPYLGLARIHAYDLRNLDALLEDIRQAEARGYVAGRRERAEIGFAFKVRADDERARAMRADGPERRRLLEAALADYDSCVAKFSGISDYLRSQDNTDLCRRLRDVVGHSIEQLEK